MSDPTTAQNAPPPPTVTVDDSPAAPAPTAPVTQEESSPAPVAEVKTPAPAAEVKESVEAKPEEAQSAPSQPEPATSVTVPKAEPEMAPSAPVVTPTPAALPGVTAVPAVATQEALPAPVPEVAKELVEEKPEPQNTLTKRFTESEWASLKEFRLQLPEIFSNAFPDKSDAKTATVTLWGVPIDPTNPTSDARVSVVLMKFLRARNLSVSAAKDMIVATLRWRESFNIEAALKEEFPEGLFGNMGVIYGFDKEKRPVVYNLYGGNTDLKAAFSDVQRFIRWRVALQERSTLLLDFNEIDQMVQIHDYAGVSLSSRDANSKAAASESSSIFGAHYPEMLYKKFFINVPMLLNWIFWAFKALVPSATMAKMSVVGTSQSSIRSALTPYIAEGELPKRYGGEAAGF